MSKRRKAKRARMFSRDKLTEAIQKDQDEGLQRLLKSKREGSFGKVRVVMNAAFELDCIKIDPSLVTEAKLEELESTIKAAVNDAARKFNGPLKEVVRKYAHPARAVVGPSSALIDIERATTNRVYGDDVLLEEDIDWILAAADMAEEALFKRLGRIEVQGEAGGGNGSSSADRVSRRGCNQHRPRVGSKG